MYVMINIFCIPHTQFFFNTSSVYQHMYYLIVLVLVLVLVLSVVDTRAMYSIDRILLNLVPSFSPPHTRPWEQG